MDLVYGSLYVMVIAKTPSLQEQQWNSKEKCVMYNNIYNKDIGTIIDLTFAKEI